MKVDVDNPNSKARGWISGRINKIENRDDPNSKHRRKGEDQDRKLEIVFPELPQRRDMLIDRWSIDLAPAGTYTKKEYDWKY